MSRFRTKLAAALLPLCQLAAPALAEASAARVTRLGELKPLDDDTLHNQRGGFVWQGVEVKLGAEIRSYLNDALVMQTNVSWSSEGAKVTRFVAGALTPAAAAELQAGILDGSALKIRIGDQQVFLANGGETAFIQRTDGAIQNIIVNTASGVQLRQEVDAQLDLTNFKAFQLDVAAYRMAHSLSETITSLVNGMLTN